MSVLDKLSPRERQVIEHVALRGMSNKLVGRKLGLSHRTMEDHRASAMKKLAVKNKSGAHPSCRLFFLKLKRA
jgi:RNA polymerase sigma factor (sigma-70 family)